MIIFALRSFIYLFIFLLTLFALNGSRSYSGLFANSADACDASFNINHFHFIFLPQRFFFFMTLFFCFLRFYVCFVSLIPSDVFEMETKCE